MSDLRSIKSSTLTAIGDAIRGRTGKTALVSPEDMPAEIESIIGENQLLPTEIVDYIKVEAAEIVSKVRAVMKEDSILSIKISDSHYYGETTNGDGLQTNVSVLHACMAIKALAYMLPLDYIAHMGDVSSGVAADTPERVKTQIETFLPWFREAAGDVPIFVAIGNHDTGIYYHNAQTDGAVHTLDGDYLYRTFTELSASDNTVFGGEEYGGYCYRDFEDKKLRVILLNTSEKLVSAQSDSGALPSQQLWAANVLKELNTKSDAADWGFVVLSHYALDYGDACPITNVFKAYVNGESITVNGTTVNFSGNNTARFYAQFHGHFHCFLVSKLHGYETYGTMISYDAWRLCTPNACYNQENGYTSRDYYGLWFCEDESYPKTIGAAEDTSFVVDVITPSEQIIHSFCYGAGYDRTVSLAGTVYYKITTKLTDTTIQSSTDTVEDGGSYTATIAAADGYTLESVTVTMGGVDVTASVYADGAIDIPSVTGNVVITAVSTKPVNYTNLVPTAQVFTAGDTSPLDGVGYRDGYYQSSSGGVGSAVSGYTCTGLIPFSKKDDGTYPTIYIKGCEWAATSQCRLYYYASGKTPLTTSSFGGTATGSTIANWLDITELGDKHYQFEPNDTMDAAPQGVAFFAISLKGSGADLIITLDEPIE